MISFKGATVRTPRPNTAERFCVLLVIFILIFALVRQRNIAVNRTVDLSSCRALLSMYGVEVGKDGGTEDIPW